MSARLTRPGAAGFTLVEMIIAMTLWSLFCGMTFELWIGLYSSAASVTTYTERQGDQMRVMDYLKRDILRATSVQIYNGATLVTGTAAGTSISLTIPHYYNDTFLDDDTSHGRPATTPTLSSGAVVYGPPLLVQYAAANGTITRSETDAGQTTAVDIANVLGGFTLSFAADTSGHILSTVAYSESMGSWSARSLTRQVTIMCAQRAQLY